MSLTPSSMVELGSKAADFSLPDGAGQVFSRDDVLKTNGLLVVFMCNHCPFVVLLKKALADLGRRLHDLNIGMVGINANDVQQYPDDSPARMLEEAAHYGYSFPYLYDEIQQVAKAYAAACTPDFFLFNGELELVYRGQFDDARPGNGIQVTGKDLYAAVNALVSGATISAEQKPSMGCNIKWR